MDLKLLFRFEITFQNEKGFIIFYFLKNRSLSLKRMGFLGEFKMSLDSPVSVDSDVNDEDKLFIQLLSPNGKTPETAYDSDSAGYDLFSSIDISINPGTSVNVPLDIAIRVPKGCYGRVAPKSGLAKEGIWINAGVIDRNYTGNIIVSMYKDRSNGKVYSIKKGAKVAQLILERITKCPIDIVDKLPETVRSDRGFGSSGV